MRLAVSLEVSAWSGVRTELAVKPARCRFEFAEGAAEARVNCTDCTDNVQALFHKQCSSRLQINAFFRNTNRPVR
jgi:hypothetical protein